MRRSTEHADVGAGAEDPLAVGAEHDGVDLRMLEPQSLCGVVELEVDAEVVGVLLEPVAGPEPRLLVDLQGQEGERRFDPELPVPVAVRVGAEVDGLCRGGLTGRVPGRSVRGGLLGHLVGGEALFLFERPLPVGEYSHAS
ncbi:MAG: hypothetical protein OXU63_14290 [Acidobacteriota bacterium]|nr:hypothetical protein [Acidobacteriota bacterium]